MFVLSFTILGKNNPLSFHPIMPESLLYAVFAFHFHANQHCSSEQFQRLVSMARLSRGYILILFHNYFNIILFHM